MSLPVNGPGDTRRSRSLLLGTTAASVVFWYIPGAFIVVYPIRLFVTLIHEAAHAIATILTGGVVQRVVIDPGGSGLTESLGGLRLLIYPAGYIGTAAFGALLLMLARPRQGRGTLAALAVVVLGVTLLWVRDPFTLIVGIALAVALLILRRALPGRAADFAASFLAVQLCLNAVLDVRTLLWMTTTTGAPNDAVFMAHSFGLAPWFWAVLWSAASVCILALALKVAWRRSRG